MAEYIEREKAIEAVNNITLFGEPVGRIINFGENILRNIPAADVKPVVHGKWEILFTEEISDCIVDHSRCTKCGLIHTFVDKHYGQYNWCPQCGARMDGET